MNNTTEPMAEGQKRAERAARIVLTAAENGDIRRAALRRAVMGTDVSRHRGARSKVHLTAKDKLRGDRRAWRRDLY
jgi:hypothetical protein